jgi:2,3-bisphosphoglycerate-dependent phosphoglycerate mutase
VTTILLARHGETDWNRERRWQGHANQPLNELGREQARELAASLDGRAIDAIYASDLARAHETAEIIGERLGMPVRADARLREVDVGDWSGRTHPEIEPDALRRWEAGEKAWSGGESYEEMGERVVGGVLALAREHPGETLLVVTHGGSIRACLAHAAGLTYHASRGTGMGSTANCELVELRVSEGRLAE